MFPMKRMEEELKSSICLEALFQSYRIVDPVTCEVFDFHDGMLIQQDGACYESFHEVTSCAGCTLADAQLLTHPMVKLEYEDGRVLLLYAVPVTLCQRSLVVELMADITLSTPRPYLEQMNTVQLHTLIEQLNDMTMKDPFTGLLHKKKSYMELRREIASAQAQQTSFCIAWIDIDHFKEVNDLYGHMTGDQVILLIAACIKQICEAHQGWAGRVGGDEFIMVFHENRKQTAAICTELSKLVGASKLTSGNASFHVSISYGVTAYQRDQKLEEFLKEADRRMYDHKRMKKGI